MDAKGPSREALSAAFSVFDERGRPGEPLTTSEVAESLDCSRRATYDRLGKLADQGYVDTKKVGAKGRVWWLAKQPDEGSDEGGTAADREEELRRERDLLEQILEAVPVSVGIVSEDGEFTRTSGSGVDHLDGVSRGAGSEVYDEDGDPVPADERPHVEVFETGEPVRDWRCRIELPEGERRWLSVDAIPLRDEAGGVDRVVVSGEDATRLVEQADRLDRRQQELEAELDEVYDRIDDAFFALDEDWRFTYVNERAEEIIDNHERELLGRSVWEAYPEAVGSAFEENYRHAMSEQEQVQFEAYYPASLETWYEVSAYPSGSGLSVYFRDVTGRKRFEETLTALNETTRELLGATTETEIGEHLVDVVNDVLDLPGVVVLHYDEVADELRPAVTSSDSDFIIDEFPPLPADERSIAWTTFADGTTRRFDDINESPLLHGDFGDTEMRAGVFVRVGDQGVLVAGEREAGAFDEHTQQLLEIVAANAEAAYDRVDRERRLEESRQRYRTLVENFPNGLVALFDEELRYVVADGQIFEEADLDPDEVVNASLPAFLPAETAETMEPHFEAAFDGEERTFDVEYAGRIFRMQTIPVTDDGGEVLAGMAVARDVTEQRERERQLESQREQLAALNDLNGVVREINEALTRQSTREEVEEVVCKRLAASDSYEFAWIGDVDTSSKTVTLRAEAGVEGYLDDTTISIDPDDPHSQGAAGRAFQTGEMQVDRRVLDDPTYEPWHDHVRDFGFRSLTSIPVTHEETLYGLLNVYSAREDAFEYEERAVLGQLGEIVGHTIASIERKRALMGDELVEVEFRIPQVFDVFDVPSTDGRITFDRTVPIGDGIYLVYGTVTEDALETLDAMVETIPHWEGLTMIEEGFDESSFELRLSEPPAISLVATQGGYVKEAVIEDDYDMTVHLPQGADIQYVVDAIQEAYPPAEALTRRQVSREDMSTAEYRQTLVDDLTERQRSVLQAAYFSGFFEWPRESSGQDVAESLGISDATFHQHVRLAQAKLVDTLFADPATRVS